MLPVTNLRTRWPGLLMLAMDDNFSVFVINFYGLWLGCVIVLKDVGITDVNYWQVASNV